MKSYLEILSKINWFISVFFIFLMLKLNLFNFPTYLSNIFYTFYHCHKDTDHFYLFFPYY
ncbi:hypothetical protein CS538_06845 [Clostridium combesii]|uniref:Uncharacterized protein n=1 Tax=Clostridium combesii TaxID=39481 RepID=A0A2G7HJK6_9CLOT|nr:hypothetical protein CS538_06845 [Clostridium combesii]